jgi:hypothetical protein
MNDRYGLNVLSFLSKRSVTCFELLGRHNCGYNYSHEWPWWDSLERAADFVVSSMWLLAGCRWANLKAPLGIVHLLIAKKRNGASFRCIVYTLIVSCVLYYILIKKKKQQWFCIGYWQRTDVILASNWAHSCLVTRWSWSIKCKNYRTNTNRIFCCLDHTGTDNSISPDFKMQASRV